MAKRRISIRKVEMAPFSRGCLNQIYNNGIEVAFADRTGAGKFIQLHPFAYCKDYLHDAVYSTINKEEVSIYGFHFGKNSVNKPVNMTETIIALTDTAKDKNTLLREAKARGKFMREIDEITGVRRKTTVKQVTNLGNKVFIFISDKMWLHSPPLISLYLLLLRVSRLYKDGDVIEYVKNFKEEDSMKMTSNDTSYIRSIFSTNKGNLLKILLEKNVELFHPEVKDNYPKGIDINAFHNRAGVVNFSKNFGSGTHVVKGWATCSTIQKSS